MSTASTEPILLADNSKTVADSIESAKIAARIAAENKGQQIVLLDLSKQTRCSTVF